MTLSRVISVTVVGMWRRNVKRAAASGAVLALGFLAAALPPGGPGKVEASYQCSDTGSTAGPFDLQAYEAGDYKTTYARALELAGFNQLFPELPSFALPRIETGDRAAGSDQTTDPYTPPVLLKAIAWIESGWAQADYNVPYGGLGPTLISSDCGYGIMQVTSGMQNISGVPNLDQAMIGGHYAFNIARGARILAGKWNQSPEFRPIVGGRDPSLIENWYFALWSYNGFALKNHPLNPYYQPGRLPFSCGPEDDGLGHDRSQYPYQELVLGCVAHPPVKGGVPLWAPQEVHLPDLADPRFAGPLKLENWNACSYEAQCAAMDIPTPNTNHKDPTVVTITRAQLLGTPSAGLSTTSVALQALPGGEGLPASVTIANNGSGVLAWRAAASASWIKLSRVQGVSLGADIGPVPSTVAITPDTSGLAPGTYTGQITIESLHGAGAPASVQVSVVNYPQGTAVVGSGPPVYLLAGGVKRAIPDPATLFAVGVTWASVHTVPDDALATFPNGNQLPSVVSEGTLLNAPGSGIFTVQGGVRRHVTSPAAMDSCGYRWDAVRIVPIEALSFIPPGDDLNGPPCPRWSPAEGSLLQNPAGTVYRVIGGVRRGFSNGASLEASGASAGNIDLLPPGMVAGVPLGRDIPDALADGNLLRASAPNVFIMEQGTRRHVANPGVMSACGYGWDAVRTVTDATIASVPTAADLAGPPCPKLLPPDGAIILGSTAAVYLIIGGEKHYIPDPGTFLALGLHWADIDRVPDSVVTSIPDGEPVPSAGHVHPNGALLLGSTPAVFVIENNLRRLVISPSVMDACGYSWSSVVLVPDDDLTEIVIGPDLTGPPCP